MLELKTLQGDLTEKEAVAILESWPYDHPVFVELRLLDRELARAGSWHASAENREEIIGYVRDFPGKSAREVAEGVDMTERIVRIVLMKAYGHSILDRARDKSGIWRWCPHGIALFLPGVRAKKTQQCATPSPLRL